MDWSRVVSLFESWGAEPGETATGWAAGTPGPIAGHPLKDVRGAAPCTFIRRSHRSTDLESPRGESVGRETVHEVWVSELGRAIIVFDDHWQAGAILTLNVFDSEEGYHSALSDLAEEEDHDDH